MTLYLRCQKCNMLDIVFKDKAKEWKCPICDDKESASYFALTMTQEEFNERRKTHDEPIENYQFHTVTVDNVQIIDVKDNGMVSFVYRPKHYDGPIVMDAKVNEELSEG